MTCARCHDHKYDPFSQRDYYGLFAIFNNTVDAPLDGNNKFHPPVLKAPTPNQEHRLRQLESALRSAEAKVNLQAASAWTTSYQATLPAIANWERSPSYQARSFDEAFATAFPAEKGEESSWTVIDIPASARIMNIVGAANAAAYLRTTITTKSEMDFGMRLGSDDAIRVWVNGKLVHDNKVARPLTVDQDTVTFRLNKGANTILVKIVNGIGQDGFSVSYGDPASLRILSVAKAIQEGKAADTDIRKTYLELGPISEQATTYRKDLADYRALDAEIPFTLVAEELPRSREAYLLKRGEYDRPVERAYRALPAIFGPWPKGLPKNRLGFAKWLTDAQHPLVSRVTVNRIWQQHFGTGIVKSAEDFGSRGDWPSHPALLDYLALRFIENGWSTKKLHREILLSNAFQQSSQVDRRKFDIDPENRLISRGPRYRLDAEVLRDQALFVAGLLKVESGGKGFKPYQPEGLWETIAFVESDTSKYVQDVGDTIYRRSLYLFWKRTSPHPTMLAFDAPMRESCTVRRTRTNTPLQALVTLNETAFVESARVFAKRVMRAAQSDGERLRWAFETALSRSPTDRERLMLEASLMRYRARFIANPSSASGLLRTGQAPLPDDTPVAELAAWSMVCSTLLNTDEILTQH
jgi:hypothetical protein